MLPMPGCGPDDLVRCFVPERRHDVGVPELVGVDRGDARLVTPALQHQVDPVGVQHRFAFRLDQKPVGEW